MTDSETTGPIDISKGIQEYGRTIRGENKTTVYVVLGSSGEYSSYVAWVAGVYDDKDAAIKEADDLKAADRSNWVTWQAWNSELLARHTKAGRQWQYKTRTADAIELGMTPEPPVGGTDTDYTVACVPMNTRGRWDYA